MGTLKDGLPKDTHNPWVLSYHTKKGDFADVVKLKNMREGRFLDY